MFPAWPMAPQEMEYMAAWMMKWSPVAALIAGPTRGEAVVAVSPPENVSRILNVDGYEVIVFDRASDTITLNVGLLRTQFDLKKP